MHGQNVGREYLYKHRLSSAYTYDVGIVVELERATKPVTTVCDTFGSGIAHFNICKRDTSWIYVDGKSDHIQLCFC